MEMDGWRNDERGNGIAGGLMGIPSSTDTHQHTPAVVLLACTHIPVAFHTPTRVNKSIKLYTSNQLSPFLLPFDSGIIRSGQSALNTA